MVTGAIIPPPIPRLSPAEKEYIMEEYRIGSNEEMKRMKLM